jgi:hypothetical protein
MRIYTLIIEKRKGGTDFIEPFLSFDEARKAFMEREGLTEEEWKAYTEYGSSFENGKYFDEEMSAEIFPKFL